jgi:hypothetical protein
MSTNITAESVVVVTGDHVSSSLGEEVVILSLKEGKYFGLDPVGARLWQLIQKPVSVLHVRDQFLEEFDVESDQCLADLLDVLEDLAIHNLVEIQN